MRLRASFAIILTCLVSWSVFARDIHTEPVVFATGTGTTTLKGAITGDEIIDYTVPVKSGQVMLISMTTNSGANYFNLMAPGETVEAFFNGSLNGNAYIGTLYKDGDYTIRVYQMRSAARRSETATFSISLEIAPEDFADGLSGGPDYWAIRTRTPGIRVNLRATPSTMAPVLEKLAPGTVLRNKGCRIAEERRWCSVEWPDNPARRGWVAGALLMESSYVNPQ